MASTIEHHAQAVETVKAAIDKALDGPRWYVVAVDAGGDGWWVDSNDQITAYRFEQATHRTSEEAEEALKRARRLARGMNGCDWFVVRDVEARTA